MAVYFKMHIQGGTEDGRISGNKVDEIDTSIC